MSDEHVDTGTFSGAEMSAMARSYAKALDEIKELEEDLTYHHAQLHERHFEIVNLKIMITELNEAITNALDILAGWSAPKSEADKITGARLTLEAVLDAQGSTEGDAQSTTTTSTLSTPHTTRSPAARHPSNPPRARPPAVDRRAREERADSDPPVRRTRLIDGQQWD